MKLLDPTFRYRIEKLNHDLDGRLTGLLTGVDDLDVLFDALEELHTDVVNLDAELDAQHEKSKKEPIRFLENNKLRVSRLNQVFDEAFHGCLIGVKSFEECALDLLEKLSVKLKDETMVEVRWSDTDGVGHGAG